MDGLTHEPPQQIQPGSQVKVPHTATAGRHSPSAHSWPSGQAMPQPPQLPGSSRVFVHWPPQQSDLGSGHCHHVQSSDFSQARPPSGGGSGVPGWNGGTS
jgi:hypothetical protein